MSSTPRCAPLPAPWTTVSACKATCLPQGYRRAAEEAADVRRGRSLLPADRVCASGWRTTRPDPPDTTAGDRPCRPARTTSSLIVNLLPPQRSKPALWISADPDQTPAAAETQARVIHRVRVVRARAPWPIGPDARGRGTFRVRPLLPAPIPRPCFGARVR